MAAAAMGYTLVGSAATTAATNLVYTDFTTNGFAPGYYPGTQDPLNYTQRQATAPHVETAEEWLRRRVREVQWKPA